jgi:hypothetical protein
METVLDELSVYDAVGEIVGVTVIEALAIRLRSACTRGRVAGLSEVAGGRLVTRVVT